MGLGKAGSAGQNFKFQHAVRTGHLRDHLLEPLMHLARLGGDRHARAAVGGDGLVDGQDVGTGAGFPGMVLALLRPDLQVTLLDSLQKRIGFLEQTAAKLGLANVRCIHARAEDGAKLPELREQFDMATARAVAAMPVLTEYCLPFVKQGGVFAAMKGPSETAEQAETAAKLLGGEIVGEESYTLPTAGERKLIRIRKTAPTPQKYPRRSDKIKKQPLG